MSKRPWGVHTLASIFSPQVMTEAPSGNGWVHAVAEPYDGNRIVAAWWVLTGRAYAIEWPKPGDLENSLTQ
jgi:hypothetical protein